MCRSLFAAVALGVALLGCSSKTASPEGEELPADAWAVRTGASFDVELPGKPRREEQRSRGALALAVVEVRTSSGTYLVVSGRVPEALRGAQNHSALAEALDGVVLAELSATLTSATDGKAAAGVAAIRWPVRDLAAKAGATECAARELFAREDVVAVAACPASAFPRLRDSLRVKVDPLPEGAVDVDPASWSAWSKSAKAHLWQQTRAKEGCDITCEVDGKPRWSASGACLGTGLDLHFVAEDCERWIVFYASPGTGTTAGGTKYLTVYDRMRLAWDVWGASLLKNKQQRGLAHAIRGMGKMPGDPPRYAPDGKAVELDTIEDAHHSVPLVADAKAASPKEDAAAEAPAEAPTAPPAEAASPPSAPAPPPTPPPAKAPTPKAAKKKKHK